MVFRALLLLIATAGASSCRAPQPAEPLRSPPVTEGATLPEDTLSAAALAADLRYLASDDLRGRRTGTPGGADAAQYIAEHFAAAGLDTVAGAPGYLQPVPPSITGTAAPSSNVLGLVPGSDPALREEVVVLIAHYDHVGAGRQYQGATEADSIFNGARDNGMGVVALLGAAQALAAEPPARSVLLAAVTAEELGLRGSRYLADHLPVPLGNVVFALNTDAAGYSDTTVVTLIGHGRTTADSLLAVGAGRYGLRLLPDPAPDQNLFDRSDNVSFAARGVPAPTFTPGFRSFSDPGVARYYHHPRDEADEDFNFAYLHRFAQAYAHAARQIADTPARPRWTPGDPYAEGRETRGEGRR